MILLCSGLLFFIHALIFSKHPTRENLPERVFHFGVAVITLYLIGRLNFWPWAKIVFLIAIFMAFLYLFVSVFAKIILRIQHLFFCFYFTFMVWFSYVPSYNLFYAIKLNSILNKESRLCDYQSWDKYSWFLYLREKYDDAIIANKMAQEALEKCNHHKHDEMVNDYTGLIKQHLFQIEHRQWLAYP